MYAIRSYYDNNPDLLAARERSKAAGFDTAASGADRLPTVSVFAGVDRSDYLGTNNVPSAVQATTSAVAGVRASIPLFQGGAPAAKRRQAQAREGAALEQEIGVEREVRNNFV